MEKQEILRSIDSLCNDIDDWTTNRVKASLEHDTQAYNDCMFELEGLLMDCNQELSYLRDYIEENMK